MFAYTVSKYRVPAFYSFQSINCSDSYIVGTQSVLNIPKTNGWYLEGKKSKIKKKNPPCF